MFEMFLFETPGYNKSFHEKEIEFYDDISIATC